jgi:cobalt-zinc-cadmium efflux system outer membrane protein
MGIAVRGAACVAATLLACAGALAAQEPVPSRPMTLAEARATARRRSPELESARQAVAAATGRERQAAAWLNPTLAYGHEQTSRAAEGNAQDILALEQPLELGGQRGARRESAGFARAAAQAREGAAAALLDFEVARAYATAVAAERRATLATQAADAFARATRVSGARVAAGDVSGYQHRRLTLESARFTATRVEALVARDSALAMLASLMGLADSGASGGPLQLVDTLTPAPLVVSADSLETLALLQRAELRAARLDSEAGAAEADLAAAERLPTPVLSGGFKREEVVGAGSFNGFVAGVSLPLPLWDRRAGAVAAARAETARRTSEVVSLERQTARDVRTAHAAHQALAQELALLSAQLGEEAVAARRSADAAFAEGEIGLLEWLDSVRAYHDAEATLVTLWAEYIARRAALERASGTPLF